MDDLTRMIEQYRQSSLGPAVIDVMIEVLIMEREQRNRLVDDLRDWTNRLEDACALCDISACTEKQLRAINNLINPK